MAVITIPGMFLTGDHASRPAANTVGSGSIYSCTTHALLYQSDGSSWTTWATLGVGDATTHIADTSDAHDASAISVLDTAANFTGTDVEAVLAELQDNIDGVGGGSAGYFTRRLLAQQGGVTSVTSDVNSTSYLAPFSTTFYHDWDFFPATHFLITAIAQSSAGGATITLQLTPSASPTNPVSAGGDDLVITNTLSEFSSGWIAVSDAMSGLVSMCLAFKGSTATVDLQTRWVDIAFKVEP